MASNELDVYRWRGSRAEPEGTLWQDLVDGLDLFMGVAFRLLPAVLALVMWTTAADMAHSTAARSAMRKDLRVTFPTEQRPRNEAQSGSIPRWSP